MLRKMPYRYLYLFLVLVFISSCSVTDFPNRNTGDSVSICLVDKYSPGFVERYTNKKNMKKLEMGMTKEEVFRIMGEPIMYEEYSYNKPDIWFYYCNWDWADAAKTEIESIPLVFKDGKLIGWGLVFYRKYKHRDWLFNTQGVFDNKKYL